MALKTSEQGRDGSFLKGKALDLKIKTTSPGQLAHSWVFDRPLSAQLSFAPSLMSTLRRNCMTKRLQRLGTLNQRATLFFLAGKRTVFKLCPCELPGSIWVPTFLTCKLTTLLMLPYGSFQRTSTAAGSSSSLGSGLHPLRSQFFTRRYLDYSPQSRPAGVAPVCVPYRKVIMGGRPSCEIQGWMNSFRALFTTVA